MKRLLILILVFWAAACQKERSVRDVEIRWDSGILKTRSASPDEERLSDLNLFVFRPDGELEAQVWLDERAFSREGGRCVLPLVRGLPVSLYACVNFGYKIKDVSCLDDLLERRFYLTYPDEYSHGIPMSGIAELDGESLAVTIPLERMMAKISLRIDRRALRKDVRFQVRSVALGDSPRSACPFAPSRTLGNLDVFSRGFERTGSQADGLNRDASAGLSQEVSVYMLENLQGDEPLLPSYLELTVDYQSDTQTTRPGTWLIYRFRLGDGQGNCDVQRNFHYHYTLRPEGNGLLTEDNWQLDRRALTEK